MGDGWDSEDVHNIKPFIKSWGGNWHSVAKHFGITAFGVNAKTVNKGEGLTPEHDELDSGQQEMFVILEGKAEFTMDGKSFIATPGCIVVAEPHVRRSVNALESPTTMLSIGAAPGRVHKPRDI